MLPEDQRDRLKTDHIEVVLVSPRNPLNIGAAARAMANFGFARLTVVAPYEPHWREAKSAVGAEKLLENARLSPSLAASVAASTLVVGTGTVERRKPEQTVVALPDLAPLIREELERGGRLSLVFGPEKHGLTRDDLALCHLLVEIPTDPEQPSMNLGQAVAVCLYELSSRLSARTQAPAHLSSAAPTAAARPVSAHLDMLAEVIQQTMVASRYSPSTMAAANAQDLRLLLRRLALNDGDARRILGLFRRILWRLRHEGSVNRNHEK